MNYLNKHILFLISSSLLLLTLFAIPLFVTLSMIVVSLISISAIYFVRNYQLDYKYLISFISQLLMLVFIVGVFILSLSFVAERLSQL
jgi:hypothetical protein